MRFVVLLGLTSAASAVQTMWAPDYEQLKVIWNGGLFGIRSALETTFYANVWNFSFPDDDACNWPRLTCAGEGNRFLRRLDLKNLGLTFEVTTAGTLFNFPNLLEIDLSNNDLSGQLTADFQKAGSGVQPMTRIALAENSLSGTFNELNLPGLKDVVTLELQGNGFTGEIPTYPTLWTLDVSRNQFSKLPTEWKNKDDPAFPLQLSILNASSLTTLNDVIPENLFYMTQLSKVDFKGCTQLRGQLPALNQDVAQTLEYWDTSGTRVAGVIPQWMTKYTGVLILDNRTSPSENYRLPKVSCEEGVDCTFAKLSIPDSRWECPCFKNAYCVAFNPECECPVNRYDDECDKLCPGASDASEPVQFACSNHGICSSGPHGNGRCTCTPGFKGDDCSLECPGGTNNTCNGNGICNEDAKCECLDKYGGAGCSSCVSGYGGSQCKTVCPGFSEGGKSGICSGNGVCSAKTGECDCNTGFFGTNCDSRLDQGAIIALSVVLSLVAIFAIVAVVLGVLAYLNWRKKQKEYADLEREMYGEEEDAVVEIEEEEDRSAIRKSQVVDMSAN